MGIYIMSDIFVKSKKNEVLSDFMDTDTVESVSLPKWLSVVDIPDNNMKGGANSEKNTDYDLESTSELESKLRQIFKDAETTEQVGGKKRTKKVDVTEDGKKKKSSKKKSSKKKSSKKKSSKKKKSKKKSSKKKKKKKKKS